jgi:hypothetical protein
VPPADNPHAAARRDGSRDRLEQLEPATARASRGRSDGRRTPLRQDGSDYSLERTFWSLVQRAPEGGPYLRREAPPSSSKNSRTPR